MKQQLIVFGAALIISAGAAMQAQSKPSAKTASAATGEVTLVGCVQLESDYRARMEAGRGGVLGSGVGAADEYVLVDVKPAKAVVGTTGSPKKVGAGGGVYTLTGAQEKNLKRDVGRQVEVVGTIENAGKESTGAALADISDLPRVRIQTWHPVGDYCPNK